MPSIIGIRADGRKAMRPSLHSRHEARLRPIEPGATVVTRGMIVLSSSMRELHRTALPRTWWQAPLALVLLLGACDRAPAPPAAAGKRAPSSASAPAPAAPTASAAADAADAPPAVALPSLDFPTGPLYVCAIAGTRSAIEYEPRVEALCRRHPEMGPCQYEREACRSKGGRVLTAQGEEVTPAVEAEYERVVRRTRFPADTPPPPAKR